MLLDRRSLFTGFVAAAALLTKGAQADLVLIDDPIRIRHARQPYAPLVWVCVGWMPTPVQGRVYVVGAAYTDEDVERRGQRVLVEAEAFVRRELTSAGRDKHLHCTHDHIDCPQPLRNRDGSLTWGL